MSTKLEETQDMREETEEIIASSLEGNVVNVKKAAEIILAQKILDRLEGIREDVAANYFGGLKPDGTPEEESEDETPEEDGDEDLESDDLGDIDLDDLDLDDIQLDDIDLEDSELEGSDE